MQQDKENSRRYKILYLNFILNKSNDNNNSDKNVV